MSNSEIVISPSGSDDAPNVQAAIDTLANGRGGTIVLDNGDWRFDSTVYLPRSSSTGRVFDMRGIGRPVIRGLASPMMRVESNWDFSIDNLSFLSGARTGVGLMISRENVSGTSGGRGILTRLAFNGFDVGLQLGDPSGTSAVSELVIEQLNVQSNRIGVQANAYNTLDMQIIQLSSGYNDYAVYTDTAGSIHIVGGSSSYDKVVAHFGTGGVFSIRGVRTEGCGLLYEAGHTTATKQVLIEACDVHAPSGTGPVIIGRWGDTVTVLGCNLAGAIGWEEVYATAVGRVGRLVMIGTTIQDGSSTVPPTPFRPANASGLPYSVTGCKFRYTASTDGMPNGQFPDVHGVVVGGKLTPLITTDLVTGQIGFWSTATTPQPVVTGSWSMGTAGKSVAQALAKLGLIVDQSVA